MSPERPEGSRKDRQGPKTSAESVAFMVLAGLVVGLGLGAGIDWLIGTFPLASAIGMFVGLAIAIYGIYLETK